MSTCPGCTGDPEDHPGDRFEMTFGEQDAPPPSAAVPDPADVEKVARAMVDGEARTFGVADWERSPEWRRDEFRRFAVAALDAARPSPDSEAVARVARPRWLDSSMTEPWHRDAVGGLIAQHTVDLGVWAERIAHTYGRSGSLEVTAVIWALLDRAALGTGDREGRR